jgi:FG-GAP-like repeat/FG-GAP repeat
MKPSFVAAAALRSDATLDIVVANAVSVLLGNRNGTFQAKVDYATGMTPASVVVADVNGDSKPDLVVSNTGANTVSVLLGDGDGTFHSKVDYPTGMEPRSVAVADVSGDGTMDLVVATSSDNTVSALLGNGDGIFRPKVDYPTGTQPSSVAVADINGDGHPDLVVTNASPGTVSVLLGIGNGTFQVHAEARIARKLGSQTIASCANGAKSPCAARCRTYGVAAAVPALYSVNRICSANTSRGRSPRPAGGPRGSARWLARARGRARRAPRVLGGQIGERRRARGLAGAGRAHQVERVLAVAGVEQRQVRVDRRDADQRGGADVLAVPAQVDLGRARAVRAAVEVDPVVAWEVRDQ